jgi:hypothetical protein
MKIEVTVSPYLFTALGKQQYKSHSAIIAIRELLQNSRDAVIRANRVPDIRIVLDGYKPPITIECRDNGCGMSEYDILKKLLYVGPPLDKKDQKGKESVGGFGVGAKIVLFSCLPWTITTHDIQFNSDAFFSGGESTTVDYLDGTNVNLTVEKGLTLSELLEAFAMVRFSTVPVQFTYDNKTELLGFTDQDKLKLYKETRFCRLYLTDTVTVFGQTISGYAIYRLKGLVQFVEDKQFNGFNVVIDINADNLDAQDPNYPLTTSREALKGNEWWSIYSLLSDFRENQGTVKAAIDDSDNEVKLYENRLFSSKPKKVKKDKDCQETPASDSQEAGNSDKPENNDPDDDVDNSDEDGLDKPDNLNDPGDQDNSDRDSPDVPDDDRAGKSVKSGRVCRSRLGVGLPVIIKGRKEKPTTDERRILRLWGEVVRLVAHDSVFGVGIVVSEHAAAARLEYGQHPYYLLNTSKLPNLTKDGLILYLWVVAQHECVHKFQEGHNETFTSKIIELAGESADLVSPAAVRLKRSTGRRV